MLKIKDIAKIQRLEMEIFEEQDSDYVDGRVVANKNRAIYRILEKITDDIFKQNTIINVIYRGMFNTNDLTYKPICNELRKLGFEIVEKIED